MMKMLRIGLAISHSFAYYRGVLRGIARYSEGRPQWLFTFIAGETQPLLTVGRQRLAGLIASVNIERTTHSSSATFAVCGRCSQNQAPPFPCWANLNGEPTSGIDD